MSNVAGAAAAGAVSGAANAYLGLYSQGINAVAGMGTAAIGGALGGSADSGRGRFDLSSMMDGSGWTVSTGGSRSSASGTGGGGRTSSEGVPDGVMPLMSMGGSSAGLMWVTIACAGVLVLVLMRKRKG